IFFYCYLVRCDAHSFPTRRSSDLAIFLATLSYAQGPNRQITVTGKVIDAGTSEPLEFATLVLQKVDDPNVITGGITDQNGEFRRSEEHTSELQSRENLVCRLLLEK